MQIITDDMPFPDVSLATKEGLLAIGGSLTVDRLIEAYSAGIFPWFEIDEPILWWSPDPRFVLFPEKLKISKSMKKLLKQNDFKLSIDKAFKTVVKQCSMVSRIGQSGTWITPKMIMVYNELFERGMAHSVEVWRNDELVGGLYGVY
ncbi:MAG: leucyl/phenylalanyl-tRNA--protein transferase, partial [Bacteroidia bacterium]|nr:leucyl/phenylalanyl-tRNA--protein transferase [Bacteroidia bacterium]